MPSSNPSNRWIFRENRSSVRGEGARAGLAASLGNVRRPTRDRLVGALIRAGELETALTDAGSEQSHTAEITNAIAAALVRPPSDSVSFERLATIAAQIPVPERVEISVSEGFAYYALHPLAYADLAQSMQLASRRAAVIGIRSIGSTLSAVVAAALEKRNVHADRITVRPEGHPYDRRTRFTDAQRRWVAAARHQQAEFLVVDEGPGLSGSSFLSVGDALLAAGVERPRIRFLCSHDVNPELLTAPCGPERWRSFQTHSVGLRRPGIDGLIDISAGLWREMLAPGVGTPSWTHMERMKFLSADKRRFFKFAGLGRFGEETGRRAELLASAGFGPKFLGVHDGYAEYETVLGRPTRREDLSRTMIERLADYCAMRAAEFAVPSSHDAALSAVVAYNYEQEFGEPAPAWLHLDAPQRLVLCDGRMQPHEWVLAAGGRITKTDGETHGDDHFFPGPCDIAWDLAGAIVEWEMDNEIEAALITRYRTLTGDDATGRIAAYIAAYAVFRASYCTMAANALRGTPEEERLSAAAQRYRFALQRRFAAREAA